MVKRNINFQIQVKFFALLIFALLLVAGCGGGGNGSSGELTTYSLTNLSEGQTYCIVVAAYNTSGNESGLSNEVCGSAGPGGTIKLGWVPNTESDLAGYRLYYGTSSRVYENSIDVGMAAQ